MSLHHPVKEKKRKSLHLSSLWIPFLYFFPAVSQEKMLILMGIATVIVVVIDIGRHFSPYLGNLFHILFGDMLREHEKKQPRIRLTGASYMMIASVLMVALFSKLIVVTALAVLMVSDSVAALVGKRFGRTPLLGKSLQGTIAFIISGWGVVVLIGLMFERAIDYATLFPITSSYYITAALAVCIGAAAELLSSKWRIDDNLSVPLSMGIFMWLVQLAI